MHDAIVVGARCTGNAIAMLLVRRGHGVLLIDRDTFPSDMVMSTHRELIGGLVGGFPDLRFEPLAIHHADKAVIVEGRMTGTHRKEWAGLKPRGRRMEIRAACVFDFDGPRLVNETAYFDFATLQRQLGPG